MGPARGQSQAYRGHEIISCEMPSLYVGDVKQRAVNKIRNVRRKGSSYELAAA